MMNLFNNYGFRRAFTYYLMKDIDEVDFLTDNNEQKQFFLTLNTLLEVIDNNSTEALNKIVEHIAESKFVNIKHYAAFISLKDELTNLNEADIYNLYSVLFEIFDHQQMSFPACQVLQDNFHLIVMDIKKGNDCPLSFEKENDIHDFENKVYEYLSNYVIEQVNDKDLTIWGEEYDVDQPKIAILRESKPFEEYEHLNCYVHIAEQKTVDQVKNASYLPGYSSMDVDRGVFFIENLITIANKDLSDACTFQIIGCEHFDSYQEMFEKLGTGSFGYSNESPEDCAKKTEILFSQYEPDGPLALRVKILSKKVLTKLHYEILKDYEKTFKGKEKSSLKNSYIYKGHPLGNSINQTYAKVIKKRRAYKLENADRTIETIVASENGLFDFRKKRNISLNLHLKDKLTQQGAYMIPIDTLYDEYILYSLEKTTANIIAEKIEETFKSKIIIIDGILTRDFVYSNEEKAVEEIIYSLSEKHTVVWM